MQTFSEGMKMSAKIKMGKCNVIIHKRECQEG